MSFPIGRNLKTVWICDRSIKNENEEHEDQFETIMQNVIDYDMCYRTWLAKKVKSENVM